MSLTAQALPEGGRDARPPAWTASWRGAALALLACAAAVYATATCDLWLRARSACLEGEKYLAWHRDPGRKAAHFDEVLAARTAELEASRRRGALSDADCAAKLVLLRRERDFRVEESSLKVAHAWFQTAVELFSPPESRWVRRARVRLAETRELWKKELDSKKVPYRDYMLE
ncbi:MAG: hypothetical protein HY924_04875 [Elusimicrobia bacterium]|nr:hypothetical protein [Elusimicrobiota bacterium]